MAYLDQMPYLFFVLWDINPNNNTERTRIWAVRPQYDRLFREVAEEWYSQYASGQIRSNNFQLHPPVNVNNDVFTNRCGIWFTLFCLWLSGMEENMKSFHILPKS